MTLGVSKPTPDSQPPLSVEQAFDLLLPLISDRRNWGAHWMEGQESLTLSAANFTQHNGGPNPFEAICRLLNDDEKHLQHKLGDALGLGGALGVNFNFSNGKAIIFSAREEDIERSNIGTDPATKVTRAEEGERLRGARNHGGYGVGGG